MKAKLEFKIASEDWEFEQIAELNYRTFVEEIPQHEENEDRTLLDKFHSENTYIICTKGRKLHGMIAVRDKRPFSLDQKLPDLNSYLPDHNCPCEFRLLSIEQDSRNLRIIQGLLVVLARFADEKGYDIALISANVKRLKFYKQFGFVDFGPRVGSEGAMYQPMYLTLKSSLEFRAKSKIMSRVPNNFSIEKDKSVNLLPGPVSAHDKVRQAMIAAPISHRSSDFKDDFNIVRDKLCELVQSSNVEILMGSGSVANDVVAAQLSLLGGKGLILSNGEFGERLIDHASRMGLAFDAIISPWGKSFDYKKIESTLSQNSEINWIWAVHSETSTGMLNDLEALKKICFNKKILLCLDCVSSIGLVPVDLKGVFLASGVSGKGLASFSGLSFVFYNGGAKASNSIPRYLDLGFYADSGGIPFTISTNLVYALKQALDVYNWKDRYKKILDFSNWVRAQLEQVGLEIVTEKDFAMPGLLTLLLPKWIDSQDLGVMLQEKGFMVHWRSQYLIDRNWIQLAFMGDIGRDEIAPLIEYMSDLKTPLRKAL